MHGNDGNQTSKYNNKIGNLSPIQCKPMVHAEGPAPKTLNG